MMRNKVFVFKCGPSCSAYNNECDPALGEEVIISPGVEIVTEGELKLGRILVGDCNTGRQTVIFDLAQVPEFSVDGQIGIHDMRIRNGSEPLVYNHDAVLAAETEAPQEMTSIVRHWHGDKLN